MSRPSLVGQSLGGRYRIDEILGRGGMSIVYKAYDPNLKRVVAIKLIHAHLADDPMFLARFEEEAAAVAQLRHPNIVQVFDFNHDSELYYMVQEFVQGETLQLRLHRLSQVGYRMPLESALRYTIQVSEAAGYAHRRGMIHRDIKPANIMLDQHDQAILMDFGIVKIAGGEQHTLTGSVVGTAQYMPPEMIRSQPPDPRSDMYSLGITLFEMVSGRPPFESDSAMTLMMMHLNEPVPDLHQLRPEVPEDLIAIIGQTLAKERDERYSSMDELAVALQGVLRRLQAGAPVEVAPATALQPTEVAPTPPPPTTPPAARVETVAGPTVADPYPIPGLGSSPAAINFGPVMPARSTSVESQPSIQPIQPPARKVSWLALSVGGLLLGALVLAVILVGAILAERGPGDTGSQANNPAGLASASQPATAFSAAAGTPSLTPEQAPTAGSGAASSPAPAIPTTPRPSPTPTIPAGVPYARINSISIDDQQRYVVDYETFEYTEQIPGRHVHFFFSTVPPYLAGEPGIGPWLMYGGPRPFTQYRLSDRPENAAQMCILVAEADHRVNLNSGNCFILPDIVSAAPAQTLACRLGPGQEYPEVDTLPIGQIALVRGISADETWWNIVHPNQSNVTCWLPRALTQISGDISQLPLVEAPPLPETTPTPALSVRITGINIDDQNRYVVAYQVQGFQESLPGTHLHFFFDTTPADQVGITGAGLRLMHGGPAPFNGYSISDRPEEAGQLCVLVANPDHSVNLDSGNCFPLPGL